MPFLLTRLELDLTVNYERGTINGTATLTVRNVSNQPAAQVPLLLNRLMHVSQVKRPDGADVRFEQDVAVFSDDSSRQVNAITVTPARPIAAGDSLVLSVRYGGILVGYTETGSLYIRDRVSKDFTIIREDAYAFPVLGILSQGVNRTAPRGSFAFSADITVPHPMVVAMGGEGGEPIRRDSLISWSYHSTAPVPFLNIAIAPYAVVESPGARIFYFPADSTGALVVSGAIDAAMKRFTQWYGPVGPRAPNLVVMEIPDGFGSQASLAAGILQTPDAFRHRSELRQLYHELSHIWNVPDLDRPSPRWNEGLASFLEFRMAAELDGWDNWDAALEQRTKSLLRGCAAPARCDSIPFVAYGGAGMTDRSYSLGMLMFFTLYQVLGAQAFDRVYHDFLERYRNTGATTVDLAAAFRQSGGPSERILEEWLLTPRWYSRLSAGESVRRIIESYRAP